MKIFIAFIFTVFTSVDAHAFTLNGNDSKLRGWDEPELVFYLNTTDCPGNVEALIDDALDMWNGVPSASVRLVRGETADTLQKVAAGQSTDMPAIFCVNDSSFQGDPDSTPGYATGFRQSSSKNVNAGYLILNVLAGGRANIEVLPRQVVKVVVAHEVGHVLGLGHSADTGALMYYDASKKTKASLAQDDIDGLTYLYPRDESGRDKLMGCGTIGSRPDSSNYLIAMLALLLPLLAASRFTLVKMFRLVMRIK